MMRNTPHVRCVGAAAVLVAWMGLGSSVMAQPSGDSTPDDSPSPATDDPSSDEAWDDLLAPPVRARRVEGAPEAAAVLRQATQTVDDERIQRRGARTLDELLQEVPSATLTRPTGTTVVPSIDGLPPAFITITRDGVPFGSRINTLDGPAPDIGSTPLGNGDVERVEIRRSVGPDGQGGVVVDVITRRPDAPAIDARLDGRATTRALARNLVTVRGATPVRSNAVEASVEHDRIESIDIDGNGQGDRPEARRTSGGAGVTADVGTRGELRARADVSSMDQTVEGLPEAPFDDRTERTHVDLSTTGRWATRGGWDVHHATRYAFSRNRFLKRVRSSGFERLNNETDIHQVLQTVDARTESGAWRWGTTAALAGWQVTRTGSSGDLDASFRPALVAGGDGAVDVGPVTIDASALGHADATGESPELDATGTLAVTVDVGGGFALSASVGRQRRRPTPEELFLVFDHADVGYRVTGAEDLRAERLHIVRTGALWEGLDGRMRVQGDLWAHRRTRAIETVFEETIGSVASYVYANAGTIESFGANAGIDVRDVVRQGTRLYASWAWLPLTRDAATGIRVPLRSVHAARLGGVVPIVRGWLDLSTDLTFTSERNPPPGAPPAPAQFTADVGLHARVTDSIRVLAEVRNLGDVADPIWGPVPGREFRLALDVSLRGSPR